MRYVLTFEGHRSGEMDYFIKVIGNMFPDLDKETIDGNRQVMVGKLVDRARHNLDSKATKEKVDYWKSLINGLLDTFKEKGSFKTGDEERQESMEDVKQYNLNLLNSSKKAKEEMKELPDYLLSQVGYATIIKFLSAEDGLNFQYLSPRMMDLGGDVDFSKKEESDDIIKDILNRPENRASWELISDKLRHYYAKRVFANTPTDRKFSSTEDAERFLRVYTEKFIYGYVLPMTETE